MFVSYYNDSNLCCDGADYICKQWLKVSLLEQFKQIPVQHFKYETGLLHVLEPLEELHQVTKVWVQDTDDV